MIKNENSNIVKKESLFQKVRRSLWMPVESLLGIAPADKVLLEQFFIVIAIFTTMVFVSFLFVSRIIGDQIDTHGKATFDRTYHHVGAIFGNLETVLFNIAADVEFLAAHDQSIDAIHEFLQNLNFNFSDVSDSVENGVRRGRFYNDIGCMGPYGVLNNQRIDGPYWEPPADFNVQATPWYIDMINGEGALVYSNPRFAPRALGKYIVSLGKALHLVVHGERQCVGALSLDVDVAQLDAFVEHMEPPTMEGSSILVNPHGTIVAHYNHSLIGTSLAKSCRAGELLAMYMNDPCHVPVPFREVGINDVLCVYHYGKLKNDWLVISVTPVKKYYYLVRLVGMILGILGMGMAAILCYLLRGLHREKVQADLRSRSKSMFLARMSHEIRTPMNVISGLSRLIAQEKKHLPSKVLKYSSEIRHASDNLLTIINDILDLSKIEAGKLDGVNVAFTLSSLLDDAISIIRSRILDKGLQFISFVDSRLPNNLVGDVVHIRQILLNMLGNAAKFTHEGHVAFDVIGTEKDEKAVTISFAVRDTGIGIKSEDHSKVFNDFSQVDIETNWNVEGTGLGLSIVKELVTRLDGSISLASQPGQGTTLTITLPIGIASWQPCAVVRDTSAHNVLVYETRQLYEQSLLRTLNNLNVPHKRVQSHSDFFQTLQNDTSITLIFVASFFYDDIAQFLDLPAFSRIRVVLLSETFEQHRPAYVYSAMLPINALHVADFLNDVTSNFGSYSDMNMNFKIPTARILVVDDNHSNLLVVEGFLAPYECHIDFVTNGKEALRCVQQRKYDLVFMDHMMPEMDGLETTARIRKLARNKENNDLGTMPIVALTANAMLGMKEMFLQNGVNDFLSKPIEPKLLCEILARWIPKEKQLRISIHDRLTQPSEETIQIPGVNTRVGILQTGGTLEGYVRVLRTLGSEWETKVGAMIKALENDDFATYRMHAHSYKSFLATIGVMPLSITAAMLENAAQSGDRATINIHHSNFVRDLRKIADSVAGVLNMRGKNMNSAINSTANNDWLFAELAQLQSAIEKMKMQQIDSIMDDLLAKHWTKEIAERLEKIMQCITLFEWQEAIRHIEQLQGEVTADGG